MNRGGEMNRYALVTEWQLLAPINRVWDALYDVAAWPRWWKYVLAVEELEKGDAAGVGALRRYTWSSRLPYRLTFNTRSTVVDKPHVLAGEAVGELTGACPGAGVSLESWRRHGGRGAWAGEPSGRRAVGGIGAQPVCGRHAAGMWPVRSRYAAGTVGPARGSQVRKFARKASTRNFSVSPVGRRSAASRSRLGVRRGMAMTARRCSLI